MFSSLPRRWVFLLKIGYVFVVSTGAVGLDSDCKAMAIYVWLGTAFFMKPQHGFTFTPWRLQHEELCMACGEKRLPHNLTGSGKAM